MDVIVRLSAARSVELNRFAVVKTSTLLFRLKSIIH